MSLFGKLDAANIPTNPFFVEKGEYSAEVVNAKYQNNKDGIKQLYLQFEITSEESQFFGNKVVKTYNLIDENMTQTDFELLPSEEKKKIRQTLASLKRDLCGNDSNTSQKGLGISLDDLNDENWNPEVLKGIKVDIGITNYGANNEGVNVRWMNLSTE
jgi:hypothetical protein